MCNMIAIMRVFICCTAWCVVCEFAQDAMANPKKDEFVIGTFNALYEPSAVVALGGQGILIFEDDGVEMVSLHNIVKDTSGFTLKKQKSAAVDIDINDIEGAAGGGDGTVFVITSHSPNKKNKRSDKREQFVQLKVEEGLDVNLLGNKGLKEAIIGELLKIDPVFTDREDEINIEGICLSESGDMLIGLRSPTYNGNAVVLSLLNPYEIASDNFTAKFSEKPLLFDLGGAGVRAMAYFASSKEYFFVSEVVTKKKKMRPRLWSWDGGKKAAVVRMDFPGLKKLRNIEGLTFFSAEGKNMALFVCDDGNKKKKQGAHYAIVNLSGIKKRENK